jgi:transposase
MSQTTVSKWRGRFVRQRLDGLYDEPRPGAPRRISDEQIERVLVRTLEETPRGATHWSIRDMAKASALGRPTVHQIWRAFGLQQASLRDVERTAALREGARVVGLYVNPPKHVVLF